MHDPDFLAFELRVPVPLRDRWASTRAREHGPQPIVVRGTGPQNRGQRVYPWWQLQGYRPRIGSTVFRFPVLIEAWHHEPGGADSGTVCRGRREGLRWLISHRSHLSWRFVPYRRVRTMLERCHDCRRRFWRRARFGLGWDSPTTVCNECHRIRHLRGLVSDLAKYVRRENTATEGWRVERAWLGSPDAAPTMVEHFTDLGVGRTGKASTPGGAA